MKRTLVTTTALVIAASGAVAQQQSDGAAGSGFDGTAPELCEAGYTRFDLNDDDRLTEDEVRQTSADAFAILDANDNGVVSFEEYVECLNAPAGTQSTPANRSPENLAEIDTDGDGVLTQQEFMAATSNAYEGMTEGDAEALAVLRRLVFVPRTVTIPDWGAMRLEDAAARSAVLFVALDTDESGDIDRDEWSIRETLIRNMEDALEEDFDEADSDASGDLTQEEFTRSNLDRAMRAEESAREAVDLGQRDDGEGDVDRETYAADDRAEDMPLQTDGEAVVDSQMKTSGDDAAADTASADAGTEGREVDDALVADDRAEDMPLQSDGEAVVDSQMKTSGEGGSSDDAADASGAATAQDGSEEAAVTMEKSTVEGENVGYGAEYEMPDTLYADEPTVYFTYDSVM